jgi:hypothetical protein
MLLHRRRSEDENAGAFPINLDAVLRTVALLGEPTIEWLLKNGAFVSHRGVVALLHDRLRYHLHLAESDYSAVSGQIHSRQYLAVHRNCHSEFLLWAGA